MSEQEARLFVVAAPSGAGKTTLVKELVKRNPDLRFSISYTTRKKRRTEVDGVDYLFVDLDTFEQKRSEGEMLEYAQVFDNYYATSRSQVEQNLAAWQGARQVRDAMPECVTVFILPPSLRELERRLRDRRTDSPEVISRRLRDALSDMSHWDEFDHIIINDDLQQAVTELEAVLAGEGEASSRDSVALRRAIARIVG